MRTGARCGFLDRSPSKPFAASVARFRSHRGAGAGARGGCGPRRADFRADDLENLRAAGVQNGRRAERLIFDDVESYAGSYIQAIGVQAKPRTARFGAGGRLHRSEYGTVSPNFVKNAAREASKAIDLSLLCVLGFAFDPHVLGAGGEYVATDESFNVAAERALVAYPYYWFA